MGVVTDRATQYALDVRDGRLVAGRLVRQACERHLHDIDHAVERGLDWRAEESETVIDFFAEVLCLPEVADTGEDDSVEEDGLPFVLQPWQQFVVGSLMGWYTRAGGRRRFRTGYIEAGKGSGKTPMCAGLLLYRAIADGEQGGQFFAAAATKDQAKIAFADCEKMVQASPSLRDLVVQTVNNLAIPSTGSFIRAISSERRGLDGKRVSGAVLDEVHEHPNATVVNKMRKGVKGRRDALILEPTNSGFDRTSVCWAHHEYSRQVLDGTTMADDWFAFVCGIDPCQSCLEAGRWFPDEECAACDSWQTEGPHWLKANPNLGVSLPWQYVRDLVRQAKGMPSEVNDLLRFVFCVWTQGTVRAVDMGSWAACQPLPSDEDLIGCPCYGGLDLGESDDLSAWARLWLLDDGSVAVKMRYWIPSAAVARFPSRPYAEWQRAGLLTVTDGDVTDFETVQSTIIGDCQTDGVVSVAYDPRSATETAQKLQAAGVQMVRIGQGFMLDGAITRTLGLVKSGQLRHGREKLLSWMASNVVLVTGIKGDKRLAKERSPEKIDGFSALVTGIDWAVVRRDRQPDNVYLTRGVRQLGA